MQSSVALHSVCICVITFQRPASLRRTLEGLAKVDLPSAVACRVLVVDNAAGGDARAVVSELTESFPFPLTAVDEGERGIPFARNRAVAEASDVDAIIWLDDDEVPRAPWLVALIEAQRLTGADIAQGPSEPVFAASSPAWVKQGGFFERQRVEHLGLIGKNYLRTSSVLVRQSVFSVSSPPFNEAMRLTGGTDSLFFIQALRAGYSAVWVDDAVVDEHVPESRATARWILRRAYRRGSVRSQMLLDTGATVPRRMQRALAGGLEFSRMFPALLRGIGKGRSGLVSGLQPAAQACGTWTGLLGRQYDEYENVHGH